MEPIVLENGNLLVPAPAYSDGVMGDGEVEVSPGDPLYEAWIHWVKSESK